MPYQTNIGLAKDKWVQAESVLENYFRSAAHDPDQENQLINAVIVARYNYINQSALLYPIR
jgi:hypothetical protein